ncbi:MAG: hypothetical protein CO103_03910 [Chloroflexi bacterium CG_4_9_14_3_um_filter_45_9]|nr:MAG: hypothetical protein AUK39_01540 [Dehalococcoidia bacterium CG2_30_46_19]PIU22788.1 MAG: hypothetical protein COT13_06580 [Chloroflexi bacterium CG08_land_8_20_14_0_20_45_12]PJB49859.1 MAG: hypothetical protein CO103_03910 [Chloroflexi bacterium CG_4_9_14_3_um_filter_45_9]
MSISKEKIRFTYQDYLCLPDDGKRYQVIEGEVYRVPAPTPYHQRILLKLVRLLSEFVEKYGLGQVYCAPCDVILSPEDIVQPDIFFISTQREDIITERNIQGVPDLVVEILSRPSAKLDRTLKAGLYQRFGVKEYWLVGPEEKQIEVLTLKGERYESAGIYTVAEHFESPLLKGFRVKAEEIF